MTCKELKFDLALYSDGALSPDRQSAVELHLEACPLCRDTIAEHQSIRTELRMMARPEMPESVLTSVRTVAASKAQRGGIMLPASRPRTNLQMWVMPYSVAAISTILLGSAFLWALASSVDRTVRSSMGNEREAATILLDTNSVRSGGGTDLSASEYARSRSAVAEDSPSVNPHGALIALSETLVGREIGEDEVVVVADVYQSGRAEIAQVVEPSHNEEAVNALAVALSSDSVPTPFVTADLDRRAETVRVVLKIQSVDVSTRELPRKRRSTRL